MRLYILRHGQTDKNKEKVLQGRLDTSLNSQGRAQAESVSEQIKNIQFDEIYVSPLNRAIETAMIATGMNREQFILDERLIEISFGEMEGKAIDNPEGNIAQFFSSPEDYLAIDGAESFDEMLRRVRDFLKELKMKYQNRKEANVLVVSHGALIHGIIMEVKNLELRDFWKANVANCAVTIVSLKDGHYEIEQESNVEDRSYLSR